MQIEKAEEEKKAAEAFHKAEEEKLATQKVEEARLAARRSRSYRCTLAGTLVSIPEEEIVHLPISTTQEEIVHLPTIIPNDPSLGIVLPMATKTRWNYFVVYNVTFPSVTRKIF